jgi:hypothetical protein
MKRIYFVTEGITDQVVIEGLIERWLGEDFIPNRIQPPSSDYAADLGGNLSEGWKGVLAWCAGERSGGEAGRDEVMRQADCLIVHIDADVTSDSDFSNPNPPYSGPCPPASDVTNLVRDRLVVEMGSTFAGNVVLAVPAQDLEAWVLTCLHPDVADQYSPIECRVEPGALLIQRAPHKLVRRKDGRIKKDKGKYETALPMIVDGWFHCTNGQKPRCVEAVRFEAEAKRVLGC